MSSAFLLHPVEKAVLRLLEDLATPTSLSVKMLYEAGEWDQLATKRVVPEHYLDSDSYWRDATAVSFLRKLEDLPTSFNRNVVAAEGFLACEKQCFRSNLRLLPYLSPGQPETDVGVSAYLKRVRKIAEGILGPCPQEVEGRFGPGATFGDRGRLTTIPDKMSTVPCLTSAAWPFILPWMATAWRNASRSAEKGLDFVQGNRFTTVPKDCTKARGIAIEPSVNLFYQLGYGRALRTRLSRAGINLAIGQDIHRRVAREASIRGHLATLDLSNASDTVCTNLVKLVLPPRWYDVLWRLRSPKTLFRGRWYLLEKFSSMGNGFTFELETLIFLCLILALDPTGQKLVPGRNVYVFGDDIIVPTEFSNDVIAALSFMGMTVNKEKSFVSGPFRESCGGDYFLGEDVRPHFLKESPCEPHQLISLANGLRRLSSDDLGRWQLVRRAWFGVLDALPSNVRRLRGPRGLGDLCIHDDDWERWQVRCRSGIRYIGVWRPARSRKVAWQNFRQDVILASALYGVPDGVPKGAKCTSETFQHCGGVTPRDAVLGYKVGWVAYS